jgi:endonuclease-3 related protein
MITKGMPLDCYRELVQKYGEPVKYWPQWCARQKSIAEREKIIIGMILVQRTTWHNADLALKNLKQAGLLALGEIAKLKNLDYLTELIRPAGFYQVKPRRLADLSRLVTIEGGVKKLMRLETENVRQKLLRLKGLGPETADTILLYALDKPVFVVDEYTKRWVASNKITQEKDYAKLQDFFEKKLPRDLAIYQNFHALIIVDQKGPERSAMEIL